jgi:hypothetical protein
MTRKEWKVAHRAARIARQKRDAPVFSFAHPAKDHGPDPLEGLEADLRRLMRAGAAEAAERMALPPLGRLFSRGRVLAMLALAAILVVGLASSLSHGSDANAGVTQVNAPVDGAGLPQASPS